MREFDGGATRDGEEGKYDYEGFLHPGVLERYAQYMHKHRIMDDGTLRDSDNWQKGMPLDVYMKSLTRHFMELWKSHRRVDGAEPCMESLCAILFNTMGYMHALMGFENFPGRMISCE